MNAWYLECQNSKGATKNVHTVSCQLCSHSVTLAWVWGTICTELMSPGWLLKYWQFLFWTNKHYGFCNRVHYCKPGFVGLSGFENKAYGVCIYHLLLLFMTSWKLAKFLASIYLDPWWVIFWLYLNFKSKFCCLVWKAALYRATFRNNHCVAQPCTIF